MRNILLFAPVVLTLYNYYERKNKKNNVIAVSLYILGIVLFVVFDQLTKQWAVNSLQKVGTIPVIGNGVRFTYTENIGAAFSVLQGQRILLLIVPGLLSLFVLCVIVSRKLDSVLGDISLMLIVAGGIGNIIDRARLGYVIDFIDFHVINFAIFNVADSCVTIGAALFIIFIICKEAAGSKKSGGRSHSNGRSHSKGAIFTRRRV